MPPIPLSGIPRSLAEMDFAAGMRACEACGDWQPVKWKTGGSGTVWTVSARCPRCSNERAYVFQCERDLFDLQPPPGELGDHQASQIFDAPALLAEIDRLSADAELAGGRESVDRILVALVELAKFIPPGADRVDIGDARLARSWIDGELVRWRELAEQLAADESRRWPSLPPQGALDRDSLDAHVKWMQRGKMGEGRLEVTNYDARGSKLDDVDMSGARLEVVRFTHAVLELAQFREAELFDVDFSRANLASAKLGGAVVRGCRFDRAQLALAELDRAHVTACTFERVVMDRSSWRDALVEESHLRRVEFGDSVLDGARFQRCDLRETQLQPKHPRVEATSRGTVFEHCDFRGANFTGRDLAGATFIACKFAGAHGTPATTEGWSVETADFSTDGDGSDVGDAGDLLDYLS